MVKHYKFNGAICKKPSQHPLYLHLPLIYSAKNDISIFLYSEIFHGKDFYETKKPITNFEDWEGKVLKDIQRNILINKTLKIDRRLALGFWSKDILNVFKIILIILMFILASST